MNDWLEDPEIGDKEDLDSEGSLSPTQQQLLNAPGGQDGADLWWTASPLAPGEEPETVSVTDRHGVPHVLDLSRLSKLGRLRSPFSVVLYGRATRNAPATVASDIQALSRFGDFLRTRPEPGIALGDINDALIETYIAWIRTRRARTGNKRSKQAAHAVAGGGLLSQGSRFTLFEVPIGYLQQLTSHPTYEAEISPEVDLFIPNPFQGGRPNFTEPLSRPQLKKLTHICRRLVVGRTMRLREAWRERDEGIGPSLAEEVFRLAEEFDNQPPCAKLWFLKIKRPKSRYPLLYSLSAEGYQEALDLWAPRAINLIPFLILFAIYFRYNPSALRALRPSELKPQPSVHGERIRGAPFKNRSGRLQHASWPVTDDLHNPKQMLETLDAWTDAARRFTPSEEREHLFVFRIRGGGSRSFAWTNSLYLPLAAFLDVHEKALGTRFTLKQLRTSVINLVHHLFDGDPVVTSRSANHRRTSTTQANYLGAGAVKTERESLAVGVREMNRWRASNGSIDPRQDKRVGSSMAATPGFECADIENGPYTKSPGRCTAYGRCPECPLGSPVVNSPTAYALIVKFEDAIRRARHVMGEEAWIARWSGILDEVERIRELRFDPSIKAAANHAIPPLPVVE